MSTQLPPTNEPSFVPQQVQPQFPQGMSSTEQQPYQAPQGLPPNGQPPIQQPTMPPKKPVYKRAWFWVVVVVAVIIIAIASSQAGGSSSNPSSPQATSAMPPATAPASTTVSEPTTETTTEPTEPATTPAGRDNSTAKAVTLGAGTFTVGSDVQPGRYVITVKKGQSGNLVISSDQDPLKINEILGGMFGVPSVTVDLEAGDTIEISSMSGVSFKPAETKLSLKLSAGNWVVGLDIAPGRYVVTPGKGQSGNFVIDNNGWFPKTNEILGGSLGVPSVTVTLDEGDEIMIMGLSEVDFKAA